MACVALFIFALVGYFLTVVPPLVPQGRRSDGGLGLGKKPKPSDEETRLLLKQVH